MRNLKSCGFVLIALASAATVLAQGADTGSLRGRLTDATGASLPGVTITASSPAVMGGTLTTVTGTEGVYRFPTLPAGVYEIKMELTGFKTVVIPNLRVNVGLALTIDRVLEVGTVAESVTVVGGLPIVDTKHTSLESTISQEALQNLPTSRDLWNSVQQSPGVVVPRENVGGLGSSQITSITAHGSSTYGTQMNINGMDMTLMHQDNGGAGYYSTDSIEEIQVTTSGISAEYAHNGVIINQAVRSGSNIVKGLGAAYWESSALQSNNVDAALTAKGVASPGAPLNRLFDGSAQVGGPILKDRIWFFEAYRDFTVDPFVLNCFVNGKQCTDKVRLQNIDSKVDMQAGPNDHVMFMYLWGRKYEPERAVSQFTTLPAAIYQDGRHNVWQAKYQRVLNKAAMLDVNFGYITTPFPQFYGPLVGNNTTAFDIGTQTRFDAPSQNFFQNGTLRTIGGNMTYFADSLFGGSHDFKFGTEARRGILPQSITKNGDLERDYNFNAPFRVIVYNTPVNLEARNYSGAGYAQDSARFGRMTVNAGVRVEWERGDLPAQSNTPNPTFSAIFGGPKTFAEQKGIVNWTTASPRVGFAFDLKGDSKTVLKASFGRYYVQIDGAAINIANRNGIASATYNWTDLNTNNYPDYPSEFISLVSLNLPAQKTILTGLKSPDIDQFNVTIQRALTPRMSVSAGFTLNKFYNQTAQTDLALPDSAYSIPSTAADPLTGQTLNYLSLGPAFRTVQNNIVLTQFAGNWNRYKGADLAFDRRFDGKWMLRVSQTFQNNYGKVGGWLDANDRTIFPYGDAGVDPRWMTRILGTYMLPWEISLGGSFRSTGGMNSFDGSSAMARTVRVRDVTTGSFYTIRVEKNGSFRQSPSNVLDFRASKTFKVGARRLEGVLDVFNVMNANTILQTGVLTGSTLNVPTQVLGPRLARVGVKFMF